MRLDPAYPLVWRTPASLQLGVDLPPVTFSDVTVAEERMLSALTRGTTREGLSLVGKSCGLTDEQVADFVERIRPVLHAPAPKTRPMVVVSGAGATVDRLAWRLTEAGLTPRLTGPVPEDAVATPLLRSTPLAILVTHYVIDPHVFGLWLRHDIPHLPITFGDTTVRVGPIIEPGIGPCLYCVERRRADENPAWQAIASQLLGRRSHAETSFVASEIAVLATRLVLNRLRIGPEATATSFTVNISDGGLSTRQWQPHPSCVCRSVSELRLEQVTVRSGTSRQPARQCSGHPDSGLQNSTRTGEVSGVPA